MRNPYEVLGLQPGASLAEVKLAYRNLAKKYHPDNYSGSPLQNAANEKMQEINEAYDSIINGNTSAGGYSNYSSYSNPYTSYSVFKLPNTSSPFVPRSTNKLNGSCAHTMLTSVPAVISPPT